MTRLLVSVLCLVSGFYALLIYLPFPYQQFVLPKLFPQFHELMIWSPLATAIGLFYCRSSFGKGGFWIWAAIMGIPLGLIGANIFHSPQPGPINYWLAIALFVAAALIQWDAKEWESTVDLEAQDLVNFVLAITWSFSIRVWQAPQSLPWLFSVKLLLIFVLLSILSLFRHFLPNAALTAYHALLHTFLLQQFVFPAISFQGPKAMIAAICMGVAISLNITTMYRLLWNTSKRLNILLLIALTVFTIFVDRKIKTLDWNGVGLLIFSVASTTLAGLVIAAILRDHRLPRFRGYYPFFVGLVVLALFHASGGLRNKSFRSPSEQILKSLTSLGRSSEEDIKFFQYLHQNSNLPSSANIQIKPISFKREKSLVMKNDFHIFIFVIDSLRRDYLSPFNPKVKNTPAIEDFARESLTFKKAFTRYGGTGLSEPSIWSGALIPHKQYVIPFGPLNSLESLLVEQHYQQFVSMDEILKQILRPIPSRKLLDEGRPSHDFQFCRTLTEVNEKVEESLNNGQKVFVYTQPQDLHISVLSHNGRGSSSYKRAISMLDRCFGDFIDRLKQKGIFEKSIIVLTSDHGDSLGENGRFGHAYTLFPEIVRVPLIIHVPDFMKRHWSPNVDKVIFTTDLSPSIYEILGLYEDRESSQVLGTPVTLLESRKGPYLLSSSYGPVFGLLNESGTELYIADGIQLREYLYSIGTTDNEISLDEKTKDFYRGVLRKQMEQLSIFYEIETREGL